MTTAPSSPSTGRRHTLINPEGLAPARGFSHVVIPAEGRLVFVAGQTSADAEGRVRGETIADQFGFAIAKVRRAVEAAGGPPADVVALEIFTTDIEAYLDDLDVIGAAYREQFGRHFPAMSMFEVNRLVHPAAKIEIVAFAVIPESAGAGERGP